MCGMPCVVRRIVACSEPSGSAAVTATALEPRHHPGPPAAARWRRARRTRTLPCGHGVTCNFPALAVYSATSPLGRTPPHARKRTHLRYRRWVGQLPEAWDTVPVRTCVQHSDGRSCDHRPRALPCKPRQQSIGCRVPATPRSPERMAGVATQSIGTPNGRPGRRRHMQPLDR